MPKYCLSMTFNHFQVERKKKEKVEKEENAVVHIIYKIPLPHQPRGQFNTDLIFFVVSHQRLFLITSYIFIFFPLA